MKGSHPVSFEEALKIVLANTTILSEEVLGVESAQGRILAKAIYAPLDMPPFDNSAMDGYALAWDLQGLTSWKIVGEVPAGSVSSIKLEPGQCMRIFTGAAIPQGADTVIQQEWTYIEKDTMTLVSGIVQKGAHIRRQASQIARGEIALEAGFLLTPGAIGFLASMGYAKVPVFRMPRIGIIVTGSELIPPGGSLGPGQIFESNSHSLIAALDGMGIQPWCVHQVPDDPSRFAPLIHEVMAESDMVLISGGISVGDHDIARDFLEKNTVETLFYKVRQRPGNPLFFGKHQDTLLFALPGNPASVLSCFYQYVFPALRKMTGFQAVELERQMLPISKPFTKKYGLTFFLKAKIRDSSVEPLEGQLSYIMRSFAEANAIIVLEETTEHIQAGEMVLVQRLPHGRN